MNENIIGLVKQFEVDRVTFEKNASARLENLNVTLYELNKHALEIDKSIQALIDQKYEIVSTKLNASLENLNNELFVKLNASLENLNNELFVSRTDISKSFLNLENSQKAAMSSMLGDLNKTIEDIRTEVMQCKSNQMKLSYSVSSLEVFRINITRDVSMRVAFTAGVTSDKSSWNSGTLVYDVVINNVGGGYNRHTGIFTAPVEGDYVFYVSIQSYERNSLFVDIVLNGSSKVRAVALGNAPHEQFETGTNLATLRLRQGDTVWVRHNNGKGFWTQSDTPVTTFSGFLI